MNISYKERTHNIHLWISLGLRRYSCGNQKHIIGQPVGVICLTVIKNTSPPFPPVRRICPFISIHDSCFPFYSWIDDPRKRFDPARSFRRKMASIS